MEFSLYFIIHYTPTSSQNKLDLLGSPAHSGSKPSEICTRILITLCLNRNEKSNTYTAGEGERVFLGGEGLYIAFQMEASVFVSAQFFFGHERQSDRCHNSTTNRKSRAKQGLPLRFPASNPLFCLCLPKSKLVALKIRLRMQRLGR